MGAASRAAHSPRPPQPPQPTAPSLPLGGTCTHFPGGAGARRTLALAQAWLLWEHWGRGCAAAGLGRKPGLWLCGPSSGVTKPWGACEMPALQGPPILGGWGPGIHRC